MMEFALSMLVTGAVLSALASAIGAWLLYYVIKTAIRDGIKESGLLDRPRKNWTDTVRDAERRGTLPDMRAD